MDAVPVDKELHKNDTMDYTSTNGGGDVMELVKSTWDRCSLLNGRSTTISNGKNNISVLQVAWEMGRRGYKSFGQLGLPDGFSWDSALLIKQTNGILVRIIPDEILLMIMKYFNFSDLLRLGMVCRRFNGLWKDEFLHKNLCSRLGIMINIVHPSLLLVCPDPWFECSIRMAAWARVIAIDENKIPYLGRPSPTDRMMAKEIGGLNPLGCFMGIKVNDYEIMRTFTKGEGVPAHAWETPGTFCVFCKKNYQTGSMYYNLTEGKACFGCYNYIHSKNEKTGIPINITGFDKRVPCTYCRSWIKKSEACLIKPYAVICYYCWSAKGFHLRVIMAQKLYNLNRKDKKVLWLGRTMLNPCEHLYSEEEKKNMSTSNSQYILGEDARAQAVIIHGSLRKAMQKSMGTLHRRLQQRKKDIQVLRMEIYKLLYLDPKAICNEVIKKAEKETNTNKAKLVAELLEGRVDLIALKKEVAGEQSGPSVHTRLMRLIYLHKLEQEDKVIEDIIQSDGDHHHQRRRQSFTGGNNTTTMDQKRSREPPSSSSSNPEKKKDQKNSSLLPAVVLPSSPPTKRQKKQS